MLTQVDYDKLCVYILYIYNTILRATATRSLQKDIHIILQINKKEILQKMFMLPTERQGKESRETHRTNQEQKIKCLI